MQTTCQRKFAYPGFKVFPGIHPSHCLRCSVTFLQDKEEDEEEHCVREYLILLSTYTIKANLTQACKTFTAFHLGITRLNLKIINNVPWYTLYHGFNARKVISEVYASFVLQYTVFGR